MGTQMEEFMNDRNNCVHIIILTHWYILFYHRKYFHKMPRQSFYEETDDSSLDGSDDIQVKDLPKRSTNRTRKVPYRLGFVDDNGSDHDLSADDISSFEGESEYAPPTKKQKTGLKTKRKASTAHPFAKATPAEPSNGTTIHATNDDEFDFLDLTTGNLDDLDFNDEFEALTRPVPINLRNEAATHTAVTAENVHEQPICHNESDTVIISHESTSNYDNGQNIHHGANVTPEETRAADNQSDIILTCNCYQKLEEKMDMINQKVTEMLARYTVLEKFFLNKSNLNDRMVEGANSTKLKSKTFMLSNNLPSNNLGTLKDFESKLGDESFLKSAVCIQIYVHDILKY